jgi:hypothetical protein
MTFSSSSDSVLSSSFSSSLTISLSSVFLPLPLRGLGPEVATYFAAGAFLEGTGFLMLLFLADVRADLLDGYLKESSSSSLSSGSSTAASLSSSWSSPASCFSPPSTSSSSSSSSELSKYLNVVRAVALYHLPYASGFTAIYFSDKAI